MKRPYANKLPYALSTWRECVIWCACEGGGWRAVNASVFGAFGVHESLKRGFYEHTVTHIPTGKRIYGAHVVWCKAMVERLTALGDWNTRAVGKLKALREAM